MRKLCALAVALLAVAMTAGGALGSHAGLDLASTEPDTLMLFGAALGIVGFALMRRGRRD